MPESGARSCKNSAIAIDSQITSPSMWSTGTRRCGLTAAIFAMPSSVSSGITTSVHWIPLWRTSSVPRIDHDE
jgi:hypothetical protein